MTPTPAYPARGWRQDLIGVTVYANVAELLQDRHLDVIDITLPTYLHAPWTIRTLKSGRPVICEKPIALNAGEAAAMLRAANRARQSLFIGQCIRSSRPMPRRAN